MLNIVFFSALVLYFLCSVCQFIASALKKEKFGTIAFAVFLIAFLLHTGYLIARGIIAKRLPMSNQFEFATTFAWGRRGRRRSGGRADGLPAPVL